VAGAPGIAKAFLWTWGIVCDSQSPPQTMDSSSKNSPPFFQGSISQRINSRAKSVQTVYSTWNLCNRSPRWVLSLSRHRKPTLETGNGALPCPRRAGRETPKLNWKSFFHFS
jgi:hypothetical protein